MADPGQLAQQLIQKHFPKFGSIRKRCTYSSNPNPIYDPDDNTIDKGTPVVQEGVWIIFDKIESSQYSDDKSVVNDMVAMIPRLDLNVVPKEIDTIIEDGTDVVWTVRGGPPGTADSLIDPAGALWSLQVRPTEKVVE